MTPDHNRRMLFLAACSGMLIFGIVMTVLGSVLPSVLEKFSIGKGEAGSLFVLLSMGILAGSLIFGPLVDRFGYKGVLIFCALAIITGFQGIAWASSIWVLQISLFLSGFGGGAINGGTNALVSDISDGKRGSRLTYIGVFYGIGAFGVPLLLGSFLDRFTYETLISAVGVMVVLPLFFFLTIRYPRPKHARGFPVAEGIGLTKETTLLLLGLVLFLQNGMGMAMAGWSAAFFNEELGVDYRRAVLFLSLYWLGLMLSRIVIGRLLLQFSAGSVLRTCYGISLFGMVLMLAGSNIITGVAGLMLIGTGFGAVFPIILAYAGDLYTRLSGTAFSIVLVMAYLGGMAVPFFIGILAEIIGLRLAMMIIPASLVVAFIVFHRVDKRMKKTRDL